MNALVYVDIDQGIHYEKMKVARNEKQNKKLRRFTYYKNIANFEVFWRDKNFGKNLWFLGSEFLLLLLFTFVLIYCSKRPKSWPKVTWICKKARLEKSRSLHFTCLRPRAKIPLIGLPHIFWLNFSLQQTSVKKNIHTCPLKQRPKLLELP